MNPSFDHMRAEEVPFVLDWARQEGWNPGVDDAEAFFATDPHGFFVARLSGAPVAAISVVNHSDDFAFLGLYLCQKNLRGRGIGKALWDHAVKHAGPRAIGLDAVPAQQDNYAASGFIRSHGTTRFCGAVTATEHTLADAQTADLVWMLPLDRAANGYAKPAFLRHWCAKSETRKTFVADGEQGFVTIRKCATGAKIGPLVAKDAQTAEHLLHGAARVFDGPTIIDLPDESQALARHCRYLGMTSEFSTARMYCGNAPPRGTPHRAIATLELG